MGGVEYAGELFANTRPSLQPHVIYSSVEFSRATNGNLHHSSQASKSNRLRYELNKLESIPVSPRLIISTID